MLDSPLKISLESKSLITSQGSLVILAKYCATGFRENLSSKFPSVGLPR